MHMHAPVLAAEPAPVLAAEPAPVLAAEPVRPKRATRATEAARKRGRQVI